MVGSEGLHVTPRDAARTRDASCHERHSSLKHLAEIQKWRVRSLRHCVWMPTRSAGPLNKVKGSLDYPADTQHELAPAGGYIASKKNGHRRVAAPELEGCQSQYPNMHPHEVMRQDPSPKPARWRHGPNCQSLVRAYMHIARQLQPKPCHD